MRQTTIYDFFEDLFDHLEAEARADQAAQEAFYEQDETPTKVDIDLADLQPKMTPIEKCILSFIEQCTAQNTIPTLDQAQAIYLLDQINAARVN